MKKYNINNTLDTTLNIIKNVDIENNKINALIPLTKDNTDKAKLDTILYINNIFKFVLINDCDIHTLSAKLIHLRDSPDTVLVQAWEQSIYARYLAVICYESIEDMGKLFGNNLRKRLDTYSLMPNYQDVLNASNNLRSKIKEISDKYKNSFYNLRNKSGAHKDHDSTITMESILKIDYPNIKDGIKGVLSLQTLFKQFMLLIEIEHDNIISSIYNKVLAGNPTFVTVMSRSTAALQGDEESPGNAEHPAS